VSAPLLTAETVRYQTILLNVTLVVATVSLLRLGKINVGGNFISVTHRALLLYSLFILMLAIFFLMKAYLDFSRSQFTRERNAHAIIELNQYLMVSRLKSQVQEYFWLIMFDDIGSTYKRYDDALARALNQEASFEHIMMKDTMKLDLEQLRKIPELADEIARMEENIRLTRAELAEDYARFEVRTEAALSRTSERLSTSSFNASSIIRKTFEDTLEPWFDARNTLVDEKLNLHLDASDGPIHLKRLEAHLQILLRVQRIRRVYFFIEVLGPVAFSIFTLIWLGAL
jgi:hypothetical protein